MIIITTTKKVTFRFRRIKERQLYDKKKFTSIFAMKARTRKFVRYQISSA